MVRWMLCAIQNARAEHLKNVVPNSRWQDISQISRFITAAEWYNQHVWPPAYTFPSVIECIPKEKPLEPLIKCFALQHGWLEGRNRVRVYSDICSAASAVRTPLGIWRAEECTLGHGHEQASQSCSFRFILWTKERRLLTRFPSAGSGQSWKRVDVF